MKKYFNAIKICSVLLLLFPFLGLPELWENIYVILLSFVIGTAIILLQHKSGLIKEEDEESSLQEYVQELKDRFKEQDIKPIKKNTRISDVSVDNE